MVEFDDLKVMEFNFKTIQLNRLNWRDFINQPNPIAAALMSKMRIEPADRPRVKVECLRLLATLRLDPARTQLISGFVDTYLRLNVQEEQVFQEAVGTLEGTEREGIMQIVTSWMEQGIAEGRTEGKLEGEQSAILRQLARRIGDVTADQQAQIRALSIYQLEALTEALLGFSQPDELTNWLHTNQD